jgi:hypothetical protein
MGILHGVPDKRHFRVPEDKAFRMANGTVLYTLDQLAEEINLSDPELFHTHVNESKNDFAAWVAGVFEEHPLAERLAQQPTPLRMVISIERYLKHDGSFPTDVPMPETFVAGN